MVNRTGIVVSLGPPPRGAVRPAIVAIRAGGIDPDPSLESLRLATSAAGAPYLRHEVTRMDIRLSRRSLIAGLGLSTPAAFGMAPASAQAPAPAAAAAPPRHQQPLYPSTAPDLARTIVGLSHFNLAEVRRLVEAQPSLARAGWDWGFGDWETPLGAASHIGRREIAELLIAHGAEPTIFSAAMLGQLDVVKALVAARPGAQRARGPHAITLAAHARVGGKDAEPVLAHLTSLGDADTRPPTQPLANEDRALIVGQYAFGPAAADRFTVDVREDQVGIERPGGTRRLLNHTGDLVFFPAGVPSVKIAFKRDAGRATQLTIADPDVYVTAARV
jgi:hypothetical protein